jgi:hypothetical protein
MGRVREVCLCSGMSVAGVAYFARRSIESEQSWSGYDTSMHHSVRVGAGAMRGYQCVSARVWHGVLVTVIDDVEVGTMSGIGKPDGGDDNSRGL